MHSIQDSTELPDSQAMLRVSHLHIQHGAQALVQDLSFELHAGQTLAVVGESGSGKSISSLALLGLLPENLQVSGQALLQGQDLLALSQEQYRQVRGHKIAMIFQEPMTALNPTRRIGKQMVDVIRQHRPLSAREARARAVALLADMQIADPQRVMERYPFELSGGMRQRVMIAIALSCNPKLLIADEPTTALDVTVQAQIMTLLNELKREFNTAIIMITHDLGVVAGICDKVLVMYAGRTMEYGKARDVFYQPAHPYSIGLLNAVPRLDAEGESLLTIPGNPPNLLRLPKGCPFQPRCPHAMEICNSAPPLDEFAPGRLRACFKPQEDLV